ncbi:hypothetical protein SAMD00019534_039020 [Acytostelium subglobosum LB1]|uniref:hypothetical protein n=1 Tax=Acytostelium subglobosum LB1 TaxID=1410327 RepID=UPI000644D946|nr:hypothetical protein SAMD00019534_039020 [Acytostelium subglobosum LB1]GAM20727.1 hypothetical protein SAMD00019534_039020 [Acytostelium subglobosum LB1]|eukprot:XP_012755861.1 hypothetical protein SAMD00019534_039020 [Acytostelium subglobosum LB1]
MNKQTSSKSSSSDNSANSTSSSDTGASSTRIQRRFLHQYGKYSSIYRHPLALWAEKWWRRAMSIAMIAVVFVILTALFPLLAIVALIADAILYSKRHGLNYVRVLAFFETYLVIEFIAIFSCMIIYLVYMLSLLVDGDAKRERWDRWNYWYQSWWGGMMMFGWSTKAMGLSVQIEIKGGNEDFIAPWSQKGIRERVAKAIGQTPKIMFLRHASFADTLVPQGILSDFFHLRYIVKQELLWDPGLDISGSRTPNFFLFRDAGAEGMEVEMEAITNLIKDFKPNGNEVTCIWPEGTRFSKSKREKVLESLKKKNDPKYEFAAKLKHTLLPRVGGALAMLEANPCADVIFCSHIGLEASSNFAQMMEGRMCNRIVKIRFSRVKYEDIPKTKQERIDWILENWVDIDTWTDKQLALEKEEHKKKYN